VIYANTYNVSIIAASGNSGGSVAYPAAYSASYPNVIGVSATDHNDTIASYSNRGPQVNVSAPGGWGSYTEGAWRYYNGSQNQGRNIFSTTPNYYFNLQYFQFYYTDVAQNYSYLAGTSMATPHVAGTAALVLSLNPNLTSSQVRSILEQTADDKGTPGRDDLYGYGRINAYKALKYTLENYNTTIGGAGEIVTFHENITVKSGVTLTIRSGTTVKFTDYSKIAVLGTLLADGVTFESADPVNNTWFGIELQSSSSQITDCIIKDAQYGLLLVNGNSSVFSYNSFRNNFYGVFVTGFSNPTFTRNGFRQNSAGDVYGDWSSSPDLGFVYSGGHNSFRSTWQVYSDYSWLIFARYNWWGSYPPNPNVSNNVDYANPLWYDPVPSLSIARSGGDVLASSGPSSGLILNTDPDVRAELERATILFLEQEYGKALGAFESIVQKYASTPAAKRALVFAEKCLEKLRRESEIGDYLKGLAMGNQKSPLRPFLDYRQAVTSAATGRFNQAVTQLADVIRQTSDKEDLKFVLHLAGSVALYSLNDQKQAREHFTALINLSPKDPLAESARVALRGLEASGRETAESQMAHATGDPSHTLALTNYPNPFNPSTMISYTVPLDGLVSLRVYDILGRVVSELVNEEKSAGRYQIRFDASELASGMYLYELRASGLRQVQKMIVSK